MTSHDDPVPAQEKLEWVTPKISLMEAGETDGSAKVPIFNENDYLSPGNNGNS